MRLALSRASDLERIHVYKSFFDIGSVGSDVRVTGLVHFTQEAFLVHIGSRVIIADGVRFLTHDGGAGLFRDKYPGLNVYPKIRVGDDVFLGIGVLILPGVTIGNRVVVGAGSVVTRNIPDGCVAAGNPAKAIRSIEEYESRVLDRGYAVTSKVGSPGWRDEVTTAAERYETSAVTRPTGDVSG